MISAVRIVYGNGKTPPSLLMLCVCVIYGSLLLAYILVMSEASRRCSDQNNLMAYLMHMQGTYVDT